MVGLLVLLNWRFRSGTLQVPDDPVVFGTADVGDQFISKFMEKYIPKDRLYRGGSV